MNKTEEVINKLGGPRKVANLLGLEYMAVWQWKNRGQVPLKHCVSLERLTHGAVTCEELRPDVFK